MRGSDHDVVQGNTCLAVSVNVAKRILLDHSGGPTLLPPHRPRGERRVRTPKETRTSRKLNVPSLENWLHFPTSKSARLLKERANRQTKTARFGLTRDSIRWRKKRRTKGQANITVKRLRREARLLATFAHLAISRIGYNMFRAQLKPR